jgi:hypothetical protein
MNSATSEIVSVCAKNNYFAASNGEGLPLKNLGEWQCRVGGDPPFYLPVISDQ